MAVCFVGASAQAQAPAKEQNVIIDAQLKGIQKFVESQESLDDATALALMNAHHWWPSWRP